jgi:hypothetical protein
MSKNPGPGLRTLRLQWQLSLREVEKRSLRFAQTFGNPAYQISASWLDRLEREEHGLTVNKLIVLAEIYNIPTEQLLRSMYPKPVQPTDPERLSVPNATMLLTEGQFEDRTRYLLPDAPLHQPPDETALLTVDNDLTPTPYTRGIIGKRDLALTPMIPAGSIVEIDTHKRAISSRKEWTNEFQRPIYFLMTRKSYVCGWCELDKTSGWLTLIPHPLSPASSRRWRYRTEIESIGRVAGVAVRFPE